MELRPVILSGGSGTRLWPLSRKTLPKQLLPLISERTLLQDSLLRLDGLQGLKPPVLVCSHEHRFLVAQQLREINVRPHLLFLEPVGRNTAPAVAVAALALVHDEPDALMLVLPADHVIRDEEAFQEAVHHAAKIAQQGYIATFGITPKSAETGYGYIRAGASLGEGAYAINHFVEKPDLAKAEGLVASGQYYWNSGMFVFRAQRFLEELRHYRPDIYEACENAVETGTSDLGFCRLSEEVFSKCPSESVDKAVMERTQTAAVVPADMGWNDVGCWSAIWSESDRDGDGNALQGDVFTKDVCNAMIRSESRFVAAIGLSDVIIIETPDAVLAINKDRVQDVKDVVEYLREHERPEYVNHRRVHRPWGWYEPIDAGERFQVKRIMVKPGEKLSLQMHHHRAEHWVVVKGTAKVICGEEERLLTENQSTYIPLGVTHRLENPGKVPLHIIEAQSGCYLGEDDIIRFDDTYGR